MALRVAIASAKVSRKAGRRRHRLGAFFFWQTTVETEPSGPMTSYRVEPRSTQYAMVGTAAHREARHGREPGNLGDAIAEGTASAATVTPATRSRRQSIRIDGTSPRLRLAHACRARARARIAGARRRKLAARSDPVEPFSRLTTQHGRFVSAPRPPPAPRSGFLLGRHDGDAVDLDASDHEFCLDGRPRWLRVGEDIRIHAVHLRKVREIRQPHSATNDVLGAAP